MYVCMYVYGPGISTPEKEEILSPPRIQGPLERQKLSISIIHCFARSTTMRVYGVILMFYAESFVPLLFSF